MKLIKSYRFWVSLSGAVGVLVMQVSKLFGLKVEASWVEEIIMSICGILVVLGLIEKPKEEDRIQDTKE